MMAKKVQSIFSWLMTEFRKSEQPHKKTPHFSAGDYGVSVANVRKDIALFYLNTPNADQVLCFAFKVPKEMTGEKHASEKI